MKAIRIIDKFLDIFKAYSVDSDTDSNGINYYIPVSYTEALKLVYNNVFFSQYIYSAPDRMTEIGPFLTVDTTEDDTKPVLRIRLRPEGQNNVKVNYTVNKEKL